MNLLGRIIVSLILAVTLLGTIGCRLAQTITSGNRNESAMLERQPDGIVVASGDGFLKVQVCANDVIRIAYAKDRAFFARKSVMTEPKRAVKTDWSLKTENGEAILSTARLQVHVDLATGAVSFFDASGKPVLAEKADGRTLTPAEVQGEQTFHVRQ